MFILILVQCLNDESVTYKAQNCYHSKWMLGYSTVNLNAHCKLLQQLCVELIFTPLYAGSSIRNVTEQFISCIHLSFVNLVLHSTPLTKSNIVMEIQTALAQ